MSPELPVLPPDIIFQPESEMDNTSFSASSDTSCANESTIFLTAQTGLLQQVFPAMLTTVRFHTPHPEEQNSKFTARVSL